MTKLTITIGLPSSGKSTWAHEQKQADPNTVIIERDGVRETLFGTRKDFTGEGQVTARQESEVTWALAAGYNVIVSDTNLNTKGHKRWRNLASKCGAAFETKSFLDVSVEECIRRDALRHDNERVGHEVIENMALRYGLVKTASEFPQIVFDPTLVNAVICDLDGTAALMGDRSPYEHGKYHLDTPNEAVHTVLWAMVDGVPLPTSLAVVYCSGRKEAARVDTLDWLAKHGFPSGPLFMRTDPDNRKDDIVKYEILRDEISKYYNPILVLDDRNQVVRMWRSQGLPTFQVADGDF